MTTCATPGCTSTDLPGGLYCTRHDTVTLVATASPEAAAELDAALTARTQ